MVLKKVAVTGVSGMLGRHVLFAANERQILCVGTSRHEPDFPVSRGSWSYMELSSWKSFRELDKLFQNVEAIVHAGAVVPKIGELLSDQYLFDVNVRSALYLGEWAIQNKIPFVFISGAIVYKDFEQRNIKESDAKTQGGFGGLYGIGKLWAEQILEYLRTKGLELIILRPSSIYGYGLSADKMVSKFLDAAAKNITINLEQPVDDCVNLVHAADVANAIFDALERKNNGVFNIAGPTTPSILEIANTCVACVGRGDVKIKLGEANRAANIRYDLNCSQAGHAFNFRSKLDLEKGIQKMWNDIKAREVVHAPSVF